MKKGPVITAIVALVAMGGVVAAFVSNASPYVTIAQAKERHGERMHLAGDIVPGSVMTDLKSGELRFKVTDTDKATILVVHRGEMPSNINSATKVVAIGGIEGDHFKSEQLLLKCPSRYESEDKEKGKG